MVCKGCGRGLRFKTGYNLCISCMNDLVDERLERFMQEEYKKEMVITKDSRKKQVYQCPKCKAIDCIHGDFVLNDWEEFKPKLMPTKGKMWCQYSYNGEMVQGNTLLDEVQELSISCIKCDYDFDGQDDELNNNIVTVIEVYRWDDE